MIAAAFIGPGPITTAARAGSDFGFTLAWALAFSVGACFVLQEAAGRAIGCYFIIDPLSGIQ